jgi:hypothetical protein
MKAGSIGICSCKVQRDKGLFSGGGIGIVALTSDVLLSTGLSNGLTNALDGELLADAREECGVAFAVGEAVDDDVLLWLCVSVRHLWGLLGLNLQRTQAAPQWVRGSSEVYPSAGSSIP